MTRRVDFDELERKARAYVRRELHAPTRADLLALLEKGVVIP